MSNGSSWTLATASLAQHTVLNLGLAAVTKSTGAGDEPWQHVTFVARLRVVSWRGESYGR